MEAPHPPIRRCDTYIVICESAERQQHGLYLFKHVLKRRSKLSQHHRNMLEAHDPE